jgi:arylsulfatase A-like enzyme
LRPHVTHVMDVMATCAEVAGAKYPASVAGRDILPPEGRSLLPALLNRPDKPRTLIFEHEGHAAIRQGDWKLVGTNVLSRDGLQPEARWELYNVAGDPCEQRNLAAEQPAMVAEMSRKFLEEARRTHVLPRP